LLLLSLPACGLSEYEGLMQKAQERADRFRDEQKYLDAPMTFPTEKDKEGHDVPLATVFFRPPKGIESKPSEKPRNNIMWQYLARPRGSEFAYVEMAFDDGEENFVNKVVGSYQRREGVPAPERKQPWPFDSWEYNDEPYGYSINIYKGGTKKIAIVYLFRKDKRDALRKAIDLSLQTLTDNAARHRFNQKSPWKLEK
jgi:hypothetical protein